MIAMMDNEVISRITRKIRATRLMKNLTIQELASRSKVSKGLLSKIENTRTLPSLPVFISILQALEISPRDFFQEMSLTSGKSYFLIRKSEYEAIEKEGRPGFHYSQILSQSIPNSNLEISLLTVAPEAKGNPTTTDGYEFKYIIKGNCQYQIHNEMLHLQEGDSIFFDSTNPHLPINNGPESVTMLVLYFVGPRS
jgi:transcriptional regulator with XRE-family HTH domain